MSTSDCFVSVVVPLRDDEDIVAGFVAETASVLDAHFAHYEFILVDDGSRDRTVEEVSALLEDRPGIRLISLSRRFGQEIAIAAGLDSVIGDFVVVMLPDADPPGLIPEMVERARQGVGVVFGVRESREGQSIFLRAGTAAFYWFANRVLRLELPKDATHFRVMSRQAVNAITQIRDRSRYLRTLMTYVGYSNQSVAYQPLQRRTPPRTKGMLEALRLAIDIIVTNSPQPLRLVSVLGLGVSFLNVLYAGYIVAVYLLKEDVAEGWVTQSMQLAVMFFFLFLLLTVLCEYIGRLLDDVKNRPLYYVVEERSSTVLIPDQNRKNVVMESVENG